MEDALVFASSPSRPAPRVQSLQNARTPKANPDRRLAAAAQPFDWALPSGYIVRPAILARS